MRKIILIDDNKERLKRLHGGYKNLTIMNDTKQIEKFLNDNSEIISYDILMIHQSLCKDKEFDLKELLKNQNEKKLIIFSGGITQSRIQKFDNLEILYINDARFYHKNLEKFINNDGENLRILLQGEKWVLFCYLHLLEKLVYHFESYHSKTIEEIIKELNFDYYVNEKILLPIFSNYGKNNIVKREILENLINDLDKKINESVLYGKLLIEK